ncbi:MAG: dethiobiotin synthase [Methylocystis sp.]
MNSYIIVGTDTNVGKTVFSAALVGALGCAYWKPVQAGLEGETDSQIVARLSGVSPNLIMPEAYRLHQPVSPHLAACADGIEIDVKNLRPPSEITNTIIELAGGVMVPWTDRALSIDIIAQWRLPVILVARTALGTINHSLLTLEALKSRNILIHGVAFVGTEATGAQHAVASFGKIRVLGRLPWLNMLTRESLQAAFLEHFNQKDF